MQQTRRKQHKIIILDGMGNTFQKVDGIWTEQDQYLIIGMKMLKFHVDFAAALIKVKIVKSGTLQIVYDHKFFFRVGDWFEHDLHLPFSVGCGAKT